jgi:hypothetical protein
LQNALEQSRELVHRAVTITFGKSQHRVLDNVQRKLFITQRELGVTKRAPFNAG